MRIVHVAPYYSPSVGGAELLLKGISEGLARRGHEVTVLTQRRTTASPSVDRSLAESETINDVVVRRFTPHFRVSELIEWIGRVPGGHGLLRALLGSILLDDFPPYFVPGLILAALRARPDLILVQNWGVRGIVCQSALSLTRRRCALVGMPLFHIESRWSYSPLLAKMIGHFDAMIALTEHERAFIQRQSSSLRPVFVVGPGVDPSAFSKRDGTRIRQCHALQGLPVVGYIGRLQREKGIQCLVAAMEILWQSDDRIRLLLAGRADAETATFLANLSPEMRSRIVVIGEFREEEKSSLFDALDVFVMPSIVESFGIVYLEAWLCQRPVIGARIGAVACVISDGIDGLLVDHTSPPSLAAAILSLVADEERRRRLAAAGREKTLAMFTWDRIADQIENVYRVLLRSPGGRSSPA